MFVSKLQFKNFKRFTDLTIDLSGLQPPPKLVLMIGANGSGKTSVFDAFEWLTLTKSSPDDNPTYYQKFAQQPVEGEIQFTDGSATRRVNGTAESSGSLPYTLFYGRSAFRQVPQLTRTAIGGREPVVVADDDRPLRYIQLDQRFENDIDILAERIVRDIFVGESYKTAELRDRYINPINQALSRIFKTDPATSLTLQSIVPPLQGKPVQMQFRKGQIEIHYDLLSSGEKEVINILFNLFIRRESYPDTIYFIDELDVHLNTTLQYDLLKEVTENWLPENCQLWTASHSLGFIQYAREAEHAAILDFDQFDFDQSHMLKPQPKDTLEVYNIAVPAAVLPNLFKDKKIILCENQNDRLFNLLGLSRQLFVGVKDKNEVYLRVRKNPELFGLMDRDYLSGVEVNNIRQQFPNLFVLGYYTFENYLYHPENLREAVPNIDVATYQAEIIRQKNEKRDAVLLGLNQTRGSYAILKNEEKIPDKDAAQMIAQALSSDDFETFYPYFNMKKGNFSHQMLETLNLPPIRLAQTRWFRGAIEKLLEVEKG